jgi:hypothetical protein
MEAENTRYSLLQKALIHRERVAELAIGLSVNRLLEIGFDYLLYPYVIYKSGILQGGVSMTILSFCACLLIIKFYDRCKRDWLGIEAIKTLREYDGSKLIGRLSKWVMQKSDTIIFFFLSVKYDPFITMIYMRHGVYNGISKRDWKILTGSLLLGNAYWTLACFMGVSLVEWVWQLMKGLV